ncbi:MAG TPA: AMP-binding protein [Actinomycetota bacterium]|jgi:long-chain acyl-CoA synthetase|nr:AMP-binding protein [Actinomycetota bacterium]
MGDVVLLTGGTGFLGTEVAARLLRRADLEIVALVLASSDDDAVHLSRRAWWHRPELREALGTRIHAVAGDVAEPHLGLDPARHGDLLDRVTQIVHTAADLRADASVQELRATNVDGVANVLEFARSAEGIERVVHVSTAYVAGRRRGSVSEDDLTGEFGFATAYEQTKYEAERLVREAASQLPISIVRPSMIVGDSRTGVIKTFNTFYVPLRLFLSGRLRIVPARRSLRVNIVPVDYVADAIVRLMFDPAGAGLTFHLTTPTDELPTAGEVIAFARRWARDRLDVRLPSPLFLPVGSRAWGRIGRVLAPYFRERRRFRRDHTDEVLGPTVPDWHDYLPILLDQATAHGFLHRSDRTVHEQAAFRMASRHLPVSFVDVDEDGAKKRRSAAVLRGEITSATAALRAMGVGYGSRVAIVGSNSTRYLVADIAIGLSGGVSVPLYSTAPPDDLADVLRRSRAELLFVGTNAVMNRIDELSTTVPIISFCTDQPSAHRDVVSWTSFLAKGEHAELPAFSPVGPDDLATIRYTSGTTGPPKGVAFTHAQLRWMAETIASLIPWSARVRPARYLSFLPMSHVVEGILGAYSPYDLPAPVEITFLGDLRRVAATLPAVRPTVFFSVPRLYQKVWEGLGRSRIGARYQRMSEGRLRRLLRPVVRRRLLRRTGLDACVQLMVGSAPVDEELLRSFRELGVEIHDAYGLTEAPLVALNRLGRNRIGTVGELLPETQIRVADDGEVLVRGPQVMVGYVEEDHQPFRGGWLSTGDLGHVDEGWLVIDGRKKDLLKTAYGKYVQASKIEMLLRRIPLVADAMVVGEGRPFCTALLWTDDIGGTAAIDRAVLEVNRRLSHPEQVKRWAVLRNDLSIERGELTANLKLKRHRLEARFRGAIESLYEGHPAAPIKAVDREEVRT